MRDMVLDLSAACSKAYEESYLTILESSYPPKFVACRYAQLNVIVCASCAVCVCSEPTLVQARKGGRPFHRREASERTRRSHPRSQAKTTRTWQTRI